jgi:Family of unknown function (DUF5657)
MVDTTMTPVIWLIAKLFVLLAIAVYAVFGGIIVRQQHLMAGVLEESFEPFLRLLTYLHLAAAIGLFLLALVIL